MGRLRSCQLPCGPQCGQLERGWEGQPTLKTVPKLSPVDGIDSLAFCPKEKIKPVLSSLLESVSAVGCLSYPSPHSHGASQQASHFPGCPAGGTHPLNVGPRSLVDLCAAPASPPEGSPPVPDAGSLVTISLVAVAFLSLGFGGCIRGSLQSCAMVFNSEFIAYKKSIRNGHTKVCSPKSNKTIHRVS